MNEATQHQTGPGAENDLTETTLRSTAVYHGTLINVRRDDVQLPNGRRTVREVVEHSDSVCMVPLDREGRVILVRQYRKPTESVLLEVPAGGIEPGETPEQAALRELQEEINHTASRLQPLGRFWLAPGWCNELMYAYLATDLCRSDLEQDYDEIVETVSAPLTDTLSLMTSGAIQDAKSIAALLLAMRVVSQSDSAG